MLWPFWLFFSSLSLQDKFEAFLLDDHISFCASHLEPCPHRCALSQVKAPRGFSPNELLLHLNNECPDHPIPCPLFAYELCSLAYAAASSSLHSSSSFTSSFSSSFSSSSQSSISSTAPTFSRKDLQMHMLEHLPWLLHTVLELREAQQQQQQHIQQLEDSVRSLTDTRAGGTRSAKANDHNKYRHRSRSRDRSGSREPSRNRSISKERPKE